jgi:hypothetical protein
VLLDELAGESQVVRERPFAARVRAPLCRTAKPRPASRPKP